MLHHLISEVYELISGFDGCSFTINGAMEDKLCVGQSKPELDQRMKPDHNCKLRTQVQLAFN